MLVQLTSDLLSRLRAHAVAAAPHEACGLVAGHRRGAKLRLERYLPQRNRSRRAAAFAIDPQDIAGAVAALHESRQVLLAVYHSHCGHAAVPSAADRRGAWPELLQLICPVYGGAVGALRAWSPELDWASVPLTTSA